MTVFGLDQTLEPTGTAFPSQTEDSLGSFDVSANLAEELIEVVVQGPFYDELTGNLSETSIVLRALAAAEPNTDIRVNLLTTVSKNRIRYLVAQGQDFEAAVAQAEQEVLSAFGIEDDGLEAFTAMDIAGSSASDAALIAVSAILLQYADDHSNSEGEKVARLTVAVSNLAKDLEDDGELNDSGLGAALPRSAVGLDVAVVTENLEEIYSGLGESISVPDIQPFVDMVAAPVPWQFAPTPGARSSAHCACVVDGKIYVIGGTGGDYGVHDVLRFDPATGQWEPRADTLLSRAYASCSVVDGVIYVVGGGPPDYHDTMEAYDPVQDAWTDKAPMPVSPSPRYMGTSTAINGKIYVAAGPQDNPLDDFNVYDPTQDAWEAVSPLPQKIMGAASATVAGTMYIFGGMKRGNSGDFELVSAVYAYDPIANTWTPRASMAQARSSLAAVALGGKVYLAGGYDGERGLSTFDEYDPATDTWTTKASMNVVRGGAAAVNVEGRVYVIGGTEGGRKWVETYDPAKDQ